MKCGHVFERFQSMSDEPVKKCPECQCKVKRVIGPGAGILFKGSGFHETDYRSSGYHADAKKEKTSESSSSSDSKSSDKGKSDKGGKSAKTESESK